jgi:hypothetical protein
MLRENTADLSEFTVRDVTSKAETVQALVSSRDEIAMELKRVDNLISQLNEEYSSRINQLQNRRKPWQEALVHIEALLKIDDHANKESAANTPNALSVTDAAFALLQRLHQPTHYKEITRKLQEDSLHIPGKNPSATLLSRISRDRRFKRAKGRGVYALSVWRIRRTHPKRKRKPGRAH